MKVVKVETLEKALTHFKREYAVKLENISDDAKSFTAKFDGGRVSTHDGFNLSARTGDLQELAGKIELVENLIRFSEEL